jgi:YesN/AraC family two-component response regulator
MARTKLKTKILLVDDNDAIRDGINETLETEGFEVFTAANVNDALQLIGSQKFDVLLSDLHMPDPGDGLTVVSAMRHSNPKAVTLIFSGYPDLKEAAAAILLQADQILVKPLATKALIKTIRERLKQGVHPQRVADNVANILEQSIHATIKEWLKRVDDDKLLLAIQMDDKARSAHLPDLFRELVHRLRYPLPLGTRALASRAAVRHGLNRRKQGYTAAMLVEESRMLQVSIFQTLQNNLHRVDFSLLLIGVMAIADEVDSQLAQAMTSYIAEVETGLSPIEALG